MDRVFLDANVLSSAAWSDGGRMRLLWDLAGVELMTSDYAAGEARRNLKDVSRLATLDELLRGVTLFEPAPGRRARPAPFDVPVDDA
jgi:hypothetical protein